MNPLPIVRATIRRHRAYFILFATIIAGAVALGVTLSAQARNLRQSSARAADKFDVLVAAPGSQTDVALSAIYLRPGSVPLLTETMLAETLHDKDSPFAAPLAFGDNHAGAPIIGTIPGFVDYLSGGLAEGRLFSTEAEAVIGVASPLALGARFKPEHGMEHHEENGSEAEEHDLLITVVGRMKPTGTPWDKAIIVPIEQVWHTHSLPAGHAPGEMRIGPPFEDTYLSGVPVVVMKPTSIISAYRLRARYKTAQSMAFFPAEVLTRLYGVLGQIETVISSISLAASALVILSLVGSVFAVLSLNRRQFAVLRILGAPQGYIMLCVWVYAATIIVFGSAFGFALGVIASGIIAYVITASTGIASMASFGWNEAKIVLEMVTAGLIVAIIPAMVIARQDPMAGTS